MKNRYIPFTTIILFALASLTLSPIAQAVVPAPDGGYPGGNTAEGQSALFSLTSGTYNTAVGLFSLRSNAEGNFNTAIGAGTLLINTANQNTATGAGALLNNTIGEHNTADGAFALFGNTIGNFNTATGDQALFSNTTGSHNTATGFIALNRNTTGISNTAIGYDALYFNTDNYNTAIGDSALLLNTTGHSNTATGVDALVSNADGSGNTALGFQAMPVNTSGSLNTAVGDSALSQNTTGSGNTVLGYQAGIGIHTADNVIAIRASGEDVSNSCYIGQIFGATSSGGTPVFVNGVGKLGTTTSSRRFKEDIKPMDKASEVILALKPVSFRYKKEIDPVGRSQFGLVAEEVEQVDPDLVVRDNEGKTYSVRYDQVNAMLLNEFLKQHQKVEAQESMIENQQGTITELKRDFEMVSARQQEEIQILSAQLKEQTAQIQKLSAQVEMSNPTTKVVLETP